MPRACVEQQPLLPHQHRLPQPGGGSCGLPPFLQAPRVLVPLAPRPVQGGSTLWPRCLLSVDLDLSSPHPASATARHTAAALLWRLRLAVTKT